MINGECHLNVKFWDFPFVEDQSCIVDQYVDMVPFLLYWIGKCLDRFSGCKIEFKWFDCALFAAALPANELDCLGILLLISATNNDIMPIQKESLCSLEADSIVSTRN